MTKFSIRNDVSFAFGFNPAGQIVSRGNSNDPFAWTESPAGATASTINGLNQVAVHGTTFTHDANGSLTWDGGRIYAYDVENRLVGTSGDLNQRTQRIHNVSIATVVAVQTAMNAVTPTGTAGAAPPLP